MSHIQQERREKRFITPRQWEAMNEALDPSKFNRMMTLRDTLNEIAGSTLELSYHAGVDTLNVLVNLPPAEIADRMLCYVEDDSTAANNGLFRFDLQSALPVDSPRIVDAIPGPGQWIQLTKSSFKHAAAHIDSTDELDGDKVDVDWNPANYTPAIVAETDDVDDLSSHLKGIDDKLGGAPNSHAASHVGADEVDGDKLDIDWNPSNYTPDAGIAEADDVDDLAAHLKGIDTQLGAAPPSHAASHIGADEVDGDKLDIDWNPSNYTPDAGIAEADDTDDLAAHLKGIDDALVFGTEFQSAENTTFASTTSTFFQQFLRMTTPALPAGTYRIEWFYVWSHDATSTDFRGRVQVDDTTNLMNPATIDGTQGEHRQQPTNSFGFGYDNNTLQRQVAFGFAIVTLGAGAHNIDVDYASEGGGMSAAIHHARLAIWRVN